MPNFEAIPLSEAKERSTTGRPARITQEYLAYIEKPVRVAPFSFAA